MFFVFCFLLYGIIIVSGDSLKLLTLKTLSKFVADDILKFIYLFFFFFFRDDSHVMSSYFL